MSRASYNGGINRLLKNACRESVRVVLAFRPAFKPFILYSSRLQPTKQNWRIGVFRQPVRARFTRRCAILALLALATSFAQTPHYTGPQALGPFRIDKEISMNSLFARLGRPPSTRGETFCYRSARGNAFLTLTRMSDVYDDTVAGAVTLSRSRDCVTHPVHVAQDDIAAWKTEKGVGLGSTEEQVQEAYDRPTTVVSLDGSDYSAIDYGDLAASDRPPKPAPDLGTKALIYRAGPNDLSLAEFGIKDGRVVWISLSYRE